jgi:hypothetical protein
MWPKGRLGVGCGGTSCQNCSVGTGKSQEVPEQACIGQQSRGDELGLGCQHQGLSQAMLSADPGDEVTGNGQFSPASISLLSSCTVQSSELKLPTMERTL